MRVGISFIDSDQNKFIYLIVDVIAELFIRIWLYSTWVVGFTVCLLAVLQQFPLNIHCIWVYWT